MKTAAPVIFWRRFLVWRGSRRAWGPWQPQFKIVDARVNRDYSPQFQLRHLLRYRDEANIAYWTSAIRAKQRPLGQDWRITRA